MNKSESEAISVEALAEEFLERRRLGERPTLAEYAARYPDLAGEIRDFFPVLGLVEDFKPGSGDLTGSLLDGATLGDGTPLERLGDFRVLREVGRGGMGVVYEAEQESLGRRVALKVLAGNRLLDPKLLIRFHREAKAAARLHHTNIVPVFGVGEAEGLHFYVMQFIQGLGLDQVLDELRKLPERAAKGGPRAQPSRRHDPTAADMARSLVTGEFAATGVHDSDATSTPPTAARREGSVSSLMTLPGQGDLSTANDSVRQYIRSVVRIGLQVAEALEYAHEQGTLHRDIKPSNLLLDAHGMVWVTDFGLAKVTAESDLTHTGDIVGTIRYMAPERFQGRCDARGDVYALGLTLYELLAKRAAFEAEDRNALIREATQSEPKRLRALDRMIPRDVETIVHKAIEKAPAHRYGSAAALAEDLRRFLEDRPITARRIGTGERLARWARRNPGIAALTATVFSLLALLALGATMAAVRVQRSEQRALQAARSAGVAAENATREARLATTAREAESAARKDVEAANVSLHATQDDLRRTVYAARMNLVQAAFEAGDASRVAVWLDQTRPRAGEPDLRGFEWPYWRRQLNAEQSSQRVLLSTNYSDMPFSNDGTRVAGLVRVSNRRFDLVVLDVATRLPVFSRPQEAAGEDPGRVRCHIALNGDGTRLACFWIFGIRSMLRVWDVASGDALFAHDEVNSNGWLLEISPDGKRVARVASRGIPTIGSEDRYVQDLGVWEVATGRRLLNVALPASPSVLSVCFRPDGERLSALISESTVTSEETRMTAHEWEVSTGQERTLGPGWTQPRRGRSRPAYSPDGRRLALVRVGRNPERGSVITMLDATTGAEIYSTDARGQSLISTTWSADGRLLALFDLFDPTVQIVDAASGRLLRALRGHAAWVSAVAFRRDGAGLVSIDRTRTIKEWDITPAALDPAASHPLAGDVTAAAVQGKGPWVAMVRSAAEDDPLTIVVQEAPRGREVGRISVPRLGPGPAVSSLSLSPDGSMVAFEERLDDDGFRPSTTKPFRIVLADVARGRVVTFDPTGVGSGTDIHPALAFRPDGRALALCGIRSVGPDEVQVRDVADGQILSRWDVRPCPTRVYRLAFRADGRALAVGLEERRNGASRILVEIRDVRDGRVIQTLEAPGFRTDLASLAFSPHGDRLAAAEGSRYVSSSSPLGHVFVWDLGRPSSPPRRLDGLPPLTAEVAFSPDGERIVAVGRKVSVRGEVFLRLWDAASGQELLSSTRSGDSLPGVTFSPDGQQLLAPLLSAGRARVGVWDARPLPVSIEAGRLVERLANDRLTRAELRAAVAAEPSVPADIHAAALEQADAWPVDRLRLLVAAQTIAGEPGGPATEWRRALDYAEAALAIVPDEEEGRYTRGLARLRLGQPALARNDLEASAHAGGDPASWGLLALAEIRLGHRPAAESALGEMTRRASRNGFTPARPIPPDLRRQAEALILDPIFPADPFVP